MSRRWLTGALIALAFIVIFVALAPASLFTDLVTSRRADVRFLDVSGSIWRGQARELEFRGTVFPEVQWQLSPLLLLSGTLGGALQVGGGDAAHEIRGQARVSVDREEIIRVDDARFVADAGFVSRLLRMPGIYLIGETELVVDELEMNEQRILALDGQVFWRDAVLTTPYSQVALGEFALQLAPSEAQGLVAEVTENRGMLDLRGNIALEQDRRYAIDGSVTTGLPPDIDAFFRNIGERRDGRYHFVFKGQSRQ